MKKRSWDDLSPAARMLVVVAGVVQAALLAAAQVDLARRPAEQVTGSKWAWRIVAFINFIGPLLYFWRGRRKPTA